MKFKKLLSGVMILSIMGTSNFLLGSTAKASQLTKSTSRLNTANISVRSPWVERKLNAQISLHGLIYWSEVTGATDYELEVIYLRDNTDIVKGYGNSTYKEENILDALNYKYRYIGKHSVNVKALDEDGNIITQETFYFNYDGVNTYMIE